MSKESIPVETSHRLVGLDPHERAVLHGACITLADGIVADAEAEDIDRDSLPQAATTFYQAMLLATEIAELAGIEHPPIEHAELMAQVIAEGDAPLAAKMAAEAVAE